MKVSLFIRTGRASKGLVPVYYRVTNGRGDKKKTPCNITVQKKYWNNGQVGQRHPNSDIINNRLRELRNKGEEAMTFWSTGQFNNTREVVAFLQNKFNATSMETFLDTMLKPTIRENDYRNLRWGLNAFKNHMSHKGELNFSDITPQYIAKYNNIGKGLVRQKKLKPKTLKSYGQSVMRICKQAQRMGIIKDMPIIDTAYYFKFGKSYKEVPSHTWQELMHTIKKADTIQKWQTNALWLLMFGLRGVNNADISRISDDLLVEIVEIREKEKLQSIENKDFFRDIYIDYGRSKNAEPMIIQLFPSVLTLLKYLKNTCVYTFIDKKCEGKPIIKGMQDRTNVFDYEKTTNEKFHSRLWASRQDKWKLMTDEKIKFKNARTTFYQVGEGLNIPTMDLEKLIGHKVGVSTDSYGNLRQPRTIKKLSRQHRDILEEYNYPKLVQTLIKQLYKLCAEDKAPNWVLANAIVGKNTMLTIDVDEWGNIKENTPKQVKIEPKYLKYFTNTKDIELDSFSDKIMDEKRKKRVYDKIFNEAKTDLKIVHQVDYKLEKVKAS